MPATVHTKIFDESAGYGAMTSLRTLVDCTIAKRGNRWWMFVCGVDNSVHEIQLFSASRPERAPLSAGGWVITPDPVDATRPALLAGKSKSFWWDGKGGRHCPSYVRGWDPEKKTWVERVYYSGAAQNFMGPYVIGYIEWDGARWVDFPAPVFTANEYWEHGSVYEPNLIYHDGMWKMWYVAGANQDDYLVQGYAESPDGRYNWSPHRIVFPAEEKVFDFAVVAVEGGFEAVYTHVNLRNADLPKTGLWWTRAKEPSANIADWSEPVRLTEAGPWKPVPRYDETDPNKLFVFYDGGYVDTTGPRVKFQFTLNCLETDRQSLRA